MYRQTNRQHINTFSPHIEITLLTLCVQTCTTDNTSHTCTNRHYTHGDWYNRKAQSSKPPFTWCIGELALAYTNNVAELVVLRHCKTSAISCTVDFTSLGTCRPPPPPLPSPGNLWLVWLGSLDCSLWPGLTINFPANLAFQVKLYRLHKVGRGIPG